MKKKKVEGLRLTYFKVYRKTKINKTEWLSHKERKLLTERNTEIGRASCRERVCEAV